MTAAQSPVNSDANTVQWLDDSEQLAWRHMVESWRLMMAVLDKDLRVAYGIGIPEYEVLVRLSESEDWSCRMSELAYEIGMSRSRLTHIVARMEKRCLVERESAVGDGRGVRCCMTDAGWELLQEAAPTHVTGVRENFVDVLDPVELKALGEMYEKVHTHLRELA